MTILDNIVNDKRIEVDLRKSLIPVKQLEASVLFHRNTISLSANLRQSDSGIIAEHKRRSPSKAVINQNLNPHLEAMLDYVDFEWGGFKGSPK